jgi:DnaK suppressor protein
VFPSRAGTISEDTPAPPSRPVAVFDPDRLAFFESVGGGLAHRVSLAGSGLADHYLPGIAHLGLSTSTTGAWAPSWAPQRYLFVVDLERARQLLASERQRIEAAIADLGREAPEEADSRVEPGDEGSEGLYQDEFDEGRARDYEAQLAALERAEARLAVGTYGLSIESGDRIPDERLEAFPTAERTIEEERTRPMG